MSGPLILAVETSCDETAVAILSRPGKILASEIASQVNLHQRFGGVVPEVASRNHLIKIQPLIQRALEHAGCFPSDLDCIAATRGPGLLTSLLVGYSAAKGLAIAVDRPFIGVNHLEGHLLSPFFGSIDGPGRSVNLIVSGGHTLLIEMECVGRYRLLGRTVDDAAGEAFDKAAKLLGLGYPGGPALERAAAGGDAARIALPRPMFGRLGADFSFSGLKTALRHRLAEMKGEASPEAIADLAASFQQAVIDCLADRTANAIEMAKDVAPVTALVVAGGVAANAGLRRRLEQVASAGGLPLVAPPARYCTDNAAMIAWAGVERLRLGLTDRMDFAPRPRWPLDPTAKPGARA